MNALPKAPAPPGLHAPASSRSGLVIGLLNNSPEQAFRTTERRFERALRQAAPECDVRLSSYALPEISRHFIGPRTHRSIDQLLNAPPDALVISGAEPRSPDLRQEPFWQSLTEVMDWARASKIPIIFSCLAAHAAVLHDRLVARRRLTQKCAGVFALTQRMDHRLLHGVAGPLCAPHSRWHALPEEALLQAGYRILTSSDQAGVDMFLDPEEDSILYLNGHPEYESSTLLREFCRDAARYLRREQDTYPDLPLMNIDARVLARLETTRRLAEAGHEEAALEFLRGMQAEPEPARPWQAMANCVLGNWLANVSHYAA